MDRMNRCLATCLVAGSLFGALAAHAAPCPPGNALFTNGTTTNVGSDPVGVAAADLNHDGKLDYAVTISHLTSGVQAGQVRIMLGNGDGTFTLGQLAPAGISPLGIALGDYNHDGITDIAVSNYGVSQIGVLLGNGTAGVGDGTFGSPLFYSCGASPHQICTADFNGDGILDIATANNGALAKSISVLLGKGTAGVGNGQFNPNVDYPIANQPVGILARDFDGDGKIDLFATEYTNGSIAFLKGKGDGTFFPAVHLFAGLEPYALDAADLNGDGKLDIIVCNSSSGGVTVLFGDGSGGVAGSNNYGVGNVANAHPADVNGDGKLDLVYTTSLSPVLGVLLGNGAGGFTAGPTVPTGGFSTYFVLADFNNDGLLDAPVALYTTSLVNFFRGQCVAAPADPNKPLITAVRDVPNDQGGKLFVTWKPSALDVTGGAVTSYRVWRRIVISAPAFAARLARDPESVRVTRETRPDGVTATVYWENAAIMPAQRLSGYGYTSATPQDSLAGSNPYTAFFITAATNNIDVFYDSPVDSGYSVDNLAPAPPAAFAVQYQSGQNVLHWPANLEADLAGYELYRGSSPAFVPTALNLVSAANETTFTDITTLGWTYKLTAIDVHGNRSPYVVVSPANPTAVEISFAQSVAIEDGVQLEWYVDARAVPQARIERRDGSDWTVLAAVQPDGAGHVAWTDHDVVRGGAYDYRLAWDSPQGVRHGGETSVLMPMLQLAFHGAQPNPAVGPQAAIAFTLPVAGRGALELFDMAGRRVVMRDLSSFAAGTHRLSLRELRLAPGVYLTRLSQAGAVASGRFVVLGD